MIGVITEVLSLRLSICLASKLTTLTHNRALLSQTPSADVSMETPSVSADAPAGSLPKASVDVAGESSGFSMPSTEGLKGAASNDQTGLIGVSAGLCLVFSSLASREKLGTRELGMCSLNAALQKVCLCACIVLFPTHWLSVLHE